MAGAKNFKPGPMLIFFFLILIGSIFVGIHFGLEAVALGLVIMVLTIVMLSIEPLTSALLTVTALLASGFIFSPQIAIGAAIILGIATIFAAVILFLRSWESGRENRQYRRRSKNRD